jgi:hypothetical protein
MDREGSKAKIMSTVVARLATLLISGFFAVGFGWGGYQAGFQPMVQTLQVAWQARSWQPVPAEVLSAQLNTSSGGKGTTYQVQARYRYHVAGKAYESSRIGLDATGQSDNVDDWHRQWVVRLQDAQARGQGITVWVNPGDPAQSLVDRSIRWPLLVFRVPFALVFTGVGVVAAGFFLYSLLGLARAVFARREAADEQVFAPSGAGLSKREGSGASVGAIWFFAIFWCGISFPIAFLIWVKPGTPWFFQVLISVFVVIGLGLIALAVRQTHMAWRYAGAALTALPMLPRAGYPVEMTLLLPARAAAYHPDQAIQLRLSQYRVDESRSGSPERRVESLTESARVQPTPDGGLRLSARFDVPPDAPPHGARRSGERVDWRLELLDHSREAVELSYDVPVQAAPAARGDEPADRFDRLAASNRLTPIAPAIPSDRWGAGSTPEGGEVLAPASVTALETPEGWQFAFSQRGWRRAAGLVMLVLLAEAVMNERVGRHGVSLPESLVAATLWWMALAFVLHAATCRWTVWVRDRGITVGRDSALWSQAQTLPGQASQGLVHKLLYSSRSGVNEQHYYAVYAYTPQGALIRLTPGLSGEGGASAMGRLIAQAWSHRQGHFSPGALREGRSAHSRPGWGWLLLGAVLAAWLWAPSLASVVRTAPTASSAAPATADATAQAQPAFTAAEEALMSAQDAGDAQALGAALAAGADPNLLSQSGSSMLMLAARRGQLEHIELLLGAGADPDLRQTRKDSERGDTALLRAFYGGHLAVAQRLVQAGARLDVRNRWDWGPVHMAAQSGCVACLQWLAERGQALDEPAPASRGETPAMLAATRGRVEALEWLASQGVDLWRKDPFGQTALDWAQWGKQAEAERWLLERRPR